MAKSNNSMLKTPGISLKRPNKPGDTAKLQQKLWRAVAAAERMLFAENTTYDDQIRAIHALVQAAGSYAKLLETAELEARIAELETALKSRPATITPLGKTG